MAFVLKSSKFIPTLVGLVRQRSLIRRQKKCFFLQGASTFNSNAFCIRTVVSLATNEVKIKEDSSQELEKSFFQLSRDVQNRNIFIEDVKNVFEVLKQKGEITYSQMILLLKCCSEVMFMSSNSERIQLAEEIWKTTMEFGTQFHISHYNALLNVFLENNHKFSPSEFLNIIRKEGAEPNVLTYRRILRAYCQQGDMEGANNILDEMKELNYPLSEDDFNSLILGHCEVGDLEKAETIIKVMEEKDIDPTAKSYIYLLCGYAKHGEIDKLTKLLDELPNKDIIVTNIIFLEIIYALAINNRTEHIDIVLERWKDDFSNMKIANRIIQRLLHSKSDSVALKVFEKIHKPEHLKEFLSNNSKFILNHFVLYREPKEVMNMCLALEEKGWLKAGLSYLLKQTFFKKDEHFCVDLLKEMQSQNVKVRSHYYWPAIIKASQKGNSEMFEILKSMPQKELANCFQTTVKIIFPNYKVGENWREDFESLSSLGLKKELLERCFLENFITTKKFAEFEGLVSTTPVNNPKQLLNHFCRILPLHPEEDKRFINAMYYLAHDYYLIKPDSLTDGIIEELTEMVNEEKTNELSNDNDRNISLFDVAVTTLSKTLKDENVFLSILEKMREKKMGITESTASSLTTLFENEKLVDAIKKLADGKLQFEFDEKILEKKRVDDRSYETSVSSSSVNALASDAESDINILLQKVESLNSFEEYAQLLRLLVGNNKHQEAIELANLLPHREDLLASSKAKESYILFIADLYGKLQPALAEKAFNLGVDMGLLQIGDFVSVVRQLFIRGNVSEAVERYCEFLEKTKNITASLEFLTRTVEEKNDEALKKLVVTLSKHMKEKYLWFNLCLALAGDGRLKEAKKLLESKKLKFGEKSFYNHCEATFRRITAKKLENYLKFVRSFEHFDRVPLYKLLIRKYARKEDLVSAKKLWSLIEEDDISNFDFLDQMRDFMCSPTLEKLNTLANMFSAAEDTTTVESVSFKKCLQQKEFDKAYEIAIAEKIGITSVKNLATELAAEGKLSEVLKLVTRYELRNVSDIAAAFLKGKKIKEYLKFLNHCVSNENFDEISNCFKLQNNLEEVENNVEFFNQYKTLAIQCYESAGIAKPLATCFVSCVIMNSKLQEAEQIYKQYIDVFKNFPLSKLNVIAMPLEWHFYRNIISSDLLKKNFSEQLPFIYSKLIVLSCEKNNLKNALDYLHTAVSEGFKSLIDKKSVTCLEDKLLKNGESFPYPELLQAET